MKPARPKAAYPRERGLVLVSVALTLAVVGALAYAMTREGSMDASAVDARYDAEVARYLAEAGVQLAKWQNEKLDCRSKASFGTVALPGGNIVAGTIERKGGSTMNIGLTATTSRGAVHTVDKTGVRVYDFGSVADATSSKGNDVMITRFFPNLAGLPYLEVTDGLSHALIKFTMPTDLNNDYVISASVRLTQIDTKSIQPGRSLALHAVTKPWAADKATWTTPWTAQGGDYLATPAASIPIAGNAEYTWRIDALVQAWADGLLADQGFLLKPSGLLGARFGSFESGTAMPLLTVRYAPHC